MDPTSPLTAADLDRHYAAACSRFGALVLQRDGLVEQATVLEAQIATVRVECGVLRGQVAALTENERRAAEAATPPPAPKLVDASK